MRTLVSGGAGFVGSNIVRKLLESGDEVTILDARAPDELLRRFLSPHWPRITFLTGDIRDSDFILRAGQIDRIDRIVHAAVFSVPLPEIELGHAREIVDVNIMGTVNLCELARAQQVTRLLYVSSQSVYGPGYQGQRRPSEESACNPVRMYGITKYAAELVARRYGALYGFDVKVARITASYGPMERVSKYRTHMSPIHDWVGSALRGQEILVPDLNYVLVTSHITDVAHGVIALLNSETAHHDTYNVSAEEEHSVGEILGAIKRLIPNAEYRVAKNESSWKDKRHYVVGGYANLLRLYYDLGFRPKFDLVTGLRDYIRWRLEYGYID